MDDEVRRLERAARSGDLDAEACLRRAVERAGGRGMLLIR